MIDSQEWHTTTLCVACGAVHLDFCACDPGKASPQLATVEDSAEYTSLRLVRTAIAFSWFITVISLGLMVDISN